MATRLLVFALSAFLGLWSRPATADALTGVALMPLETTVDLVPAGRQVLAAVRDAFDKAPGFVERGPIEMGLDEARLSFSCFDERPGCMAQVGALVDADLLLWGRLQRKDAEWTLELHLVDIERATAQDRVLRESGDGAVDRLARAAAELVVGRALEVEGTLVVRSLPAGASVYVDGSMRGTTPVDLKLPSGNYALELRMSGMVRWQKDVELGTGTVHLDANLVEVREVDGAAEEVDGRARSSAGADRTDLWLAAGTGVLAVAAGATAVVFGIEVSDRADDASNAASPEAYEAARDPFESAQLKTNVALGVTAVAAGVSGYFLYRWLSSDGGTPTAEVSIGPGSAMLQTRF
jgi:hypothetical protein